LGEGTIGRGKVKREGDGENDWSIRYAWWKGYDEIHLKIIRKLKRGSWVKKTKRGGEYDPCLHVGILQWSTSYCTVKIYASENNLLKILINVNIVWVNFYSYFEQFFTLLRVNLYLGLTVRNY
jgi:hypothetical protein